MAAVVNNLTQIDQIARSAFTSATVADADGPIPVNNGNGRRLSGAGGGGGQLGNSGTTFTNGDVYTATFNLPSAVDVSGDHSCLIIHYQNVSTFSALSTSDDPDGIRFYLFSGAGTTNWARYDSTGPRGILDWTPIVAGAGTPTATGGTFDSTNVTSIAIGWKARTTGTFTCQFNISQLLHVEDILEFGDDNGDATTFEDYVDLLDPEGGQDYHSRIIVQRAGPTYEVGAPFTITARNFSGSVIGIAFANDNLSYKTANVAAEFWEFGLVPVSGSISMDNFTFATNSNIFDVVIDSTSGTVNLSSGLMTTVNNVTISGANTNIDATTITNPVNVDIADGDLSVVVNNVTNPIVWSADLVSGSQITTDSDLDITFPETDLSDIGITFTASNTVTVTPTTGSGEYDLSLLTTAGTVTFDNDTANNTTVALSPGVTNAVASPTTGGGGVTVLSAPVTLTIQSTNSDLTGAEIRIYEFDQPATSTFFGTELAGIESNPGTTFVTTAVDPSNTVWIQIIQPGFEEFGQEFTMGASSQIFNAIREIEINV